MTAIRFEMSRQAASQRRTKNPETEEDMQEHEAEAVMDSEMKQQAGDNNKAEGGLNLQNIMEFMAEQNKQMLRQINEKIENIIESINEKIENANENLRKQN